MSTWKFDKLNLKTGRCFMHPKNMVLIFAFVLSSCETFTRSEQATETTENTALTNTNVRQKYSLSEDRSQFEQLRRDIPQSQQLKNDEKAIYIEWMLGFRKEPSEIRSKYNDLINRKREKFNNDMNKIREEYSTAESQRKKTFTDELNQERESIKSMKTTRERKTELYNEIDSKRKNFFIEVKTQRDNFESDYREKRKDFEEYIKEKRDEFNSDLKEYTAQYSDNKKGK